MSEKLMTYNKDGVPLGLKDRDEIHQNGDLHHTVQCFVVNSAGDLLMQRRHPKKVGSPNKWDVSCSGHCTDGETPISGLGREAAEELGLDIDVSHLVSLGSYEYTSQEGRNHEIIYVYLYPLEFNVSDIHFQAEEVAEVCAIPYTQLKERVMRKDETLAPRYSGFELFFKYCEGL